MCLIVLNYARTALYGISIFAIVGDLLYDLENLI